LQADEEEKNGQAGRFGGPLGGGGQAGDGQDAGGASATGEAAATARGQAGAGSANAAGMAAGFAPPGWQCSTQASLPGDGSDPVPEPSPSAMP
jgi:hypothetical protein